MFFRDEPSGHPRQLDGELANSCGRPQRQRYSKVATAGLEKASYAAVDAAIQVHGGAGFDDDSDVITMYPMIRVLRVAPLNNEMILNYIANHVLGLPRGY
jgi:alkylation response protein AidB-like acyl-CoA dehydrogenase